MRDYLDKDKMCCDLLGSAGCRVLDEDQILHILAGLGKEYDPVVVTITSKADSWSVQDMSTLLLSFESRLESTNNSSINLDGSQPSTNIAQATSQRRENFSNHHRGGFAGYRRIEGGRGTGYRGGRGGRGRFSSNRPNCQLCQKPGHTADKCWYRFEKNFTPQNPHQQQLQQPNHGQDQPSIFGRHPTANMAQARSNNSQSHHFPSEFNFDGGSSSSWYPDSGATNHISNDLSNLNISSEYQGGMKLQLGNGKAIDIAHIGHSFLNASPSPNSRSLLLNHLLHVPQITKNLLSVSQFARDNSVFFEFHPSACFVKDQVTKETLLKGTLSHGLYKFCLHKPSYLTAHPSFPNFSKKTPSSPQACSVAGHAPAANSHSTVSTPSLELWHNRLGHCAFDIVRKALTSCNVSFNSIKSNSLCQACCLAKSHRLPYIASSTQYSSPLQLIRSDLWVPSPIVSRNEFSYYVTLITFQDSRGYIC